MGRYLILARHSYAEKTYSGIDKHRHLRNKGIDVAEKHRAAIASYPVDFAVVSGAIRTTETFEIFNEELNLAKDKVWLNHELYLTDLDVLLDAIKTIENDVKCLLVVGHNPTISIAGMFFDSEQSDFSLRPGEALVFKLHKGWLEIDRAQGHLEEYIKIQD